MSCVDVSEKMSFIDFSKTLQKTLKRLRMTQEFWLHTLAA